MRFDGSWRLCDDGVVRPIFSAAVRAENGTWVPAVCSARAIGTRSRAHSAVKCRFAVSDLSLRGVRPGFLQAVSSAGRRHPAPRARKMARNRLQKPEIRETPARFRDLGRSRRAMGRRKPTHTNVPRPRQRRAVSVRLYFTLVVHVKCRRSGGGPPGHERSRPARMAPAGSHGPEVRTTIRLTRGKGPGQRPILSDKSARL